MRYPSFLRVVFGGLALLFAGQASSQVTKPKTVLEIISNRVIWGKDFPLALAQMEALSKSDDKTAELSPTKMTLSKLYANAQAADASLKSITKALIGAERQDLFKKTKKNFPFEARSPKIEVVKAPQNDSVFVSLNFGPTEFLRPDLRITQIEKELGAAERVGYRVYEGRGEERPLIITYHSYADGAIIFAESNYSDQPRLVDRVYFDTPKLVTALKSSLK
ncbi:MAG: hypothetical protein H7246_19815 [Phycisphaerae bacterium]|nr:hypothetical protein [Saprospiraceae bacterium]